MARYLLCSNSHVPTIGAVSGTTKFALKFQVKNSDCLSSGTRLLMITMTAESNRISRLVNISCNIAIIANTSSGYRGEAKVNIAANSTMEAMFKY